MWTVAVDLDGTLAESTAPENYASARPIKENIAKVNRLADNGWRIVIHTCRPWFLYDITKKWLDNRVVKYDQIVMGKLYAHAYVDDMNNDFDSLLAQGAKNR